MAALEKSMAYRARCQTWASKRLSERRLTVKGSDRAIHHRCACSAIRLVAMSAVAAILADQAVLRQLIGHRDQIGFERSAIDLEALEHQPRNIGDAAPSIHRLDERTSRIVACKEISVVSAHEHPTAPFAQTAKGRIWRQSER